MQKFPLFFLDRYLIQILNKYISAGKMFVKRGGEILGGKRGLREFT